MTRKARKAVLALLAGLLLTLSPVFAQDNGAKSKPAPRPAPAAQAPAAPAAAPEQPASSDLGARLDAAKQGLDQIVATLGGEGLTDADLAKQATAIPPLAEQIDGVIAEVTPRQAALKARLDQLGAPPDPKAVPAPPPEDPVVAQERKDQTRLFTASDDLLKRANLLQVRASQLSATIADRRRALFANEVFKSSSSILAPRLWLEVARETPAALSSGRAAAASFSASLSASLADGAGLAFFALLALILGLVLAIGLFARRLIPRTQARRPPNELKKAAAALWTALAITAIPVAGYVAVIALTDWFGLSAPQLKPLLQALFAAVVRLSLVAGLGTAVLAPGRPLWRPLDLTDRVAKRIMNLVLSIAVLVTLGKIVEAVNDIVDASLQATVASRGVFALLVALTLARGLYGIIGAPSFDLDDDDEASAPVVEESPWWPPIRFAAWTGVFAIIGADLLGYVSLAAFIVGQLTWLALVASLLFLLLRLVNEGAEQGFRPNSRLSRGLTASLGLRRESLQQIGVLLSALGSVALSAAAVLLVLAPWGLQSQDMLGAFASAFFGFKIGDVTISLSSVCVGLFLFGVGYGLTHAAQNWLENRFLPLTSLDQGLRASIRTSVGYVGVIASLAFAFAYLGINTEKLALVAGALSVGIGLGLQSVVNNFVSGLILLWERAIRVGDWVLIGENQGFVRRINVRSTEIETFDRATMIVPNGHMVTDIVKNFVRGDRVGRIKIPVQVLWGSEPEKVRDLMLKIAKAHEEVVGIPAPTVFFTGFSASALEFELVCFVEDVERAARVKSDLHFAVFKGFGEAGLRMNPAPPAPASIALDLAQVEPLLQRLVDRPKNIEP